MTNENTHENRTDSLIIKVPTDLSGFIDGDDPKNEPELREFINKIKEKKLASNIEVHSSGSLYVDYDLHIRSDYEKKDIPRIMSRIKQDLNDLDELAVNAEFTLEEKPLIGDILSTVGGNGEYRHFYVIFLFEFGGNDGITEKEKMFKEIELFFVPG